MIDQDAESRSSESDTSQPSNGPTSGADDAPKPPGRTHPTTATFRLSFGTKGQAKDAARRRGMSLSAFCREAVQDALRTDKRNPGAV